MSEQPPKPKTQKEIEEAKKKMVDSFTPTLKQRVVDLKIGEANEDEKEKQLNSISEESKDSYDAKSEIKEEKEESESEENLNSLKNTQRDLNEISKIISDPKRAEEIPEEIREGVLEDYFILKEKRDLEKKMQEDIDLSKEKKPDGDRSKSESIPNTKRGKEKKKPDFTPEEISKYGIRSDEENARAIKQTNEELKDFYNQKKESDSKIEPPVILHEEPPRPENPPSLNQETEPRTTSNNVEAPAVNRDAPPATARTAEAIRNVAPSVPISVERGPKKEYTPDQARKVLDLLCGNGDFSLVAYNASADDRTLLQDILKKDWKMISPADKAKVIPVIERTFTQRVVDKALEVYEIKDAREAIRIDVLRHAKEKGISYEDSLKIMKSKLREGDRSYSNLELSNRFEPTLKELKTLMLKDKAAALEEEFKGHGYTPEQIDALLVEKIVTGKKTRIFNGKKGEYEEVNLTNSYEQLLLKMVFREQQIDQRKIEEIYEAEQLKHPGIFKKAMTQLSKIQRPYRSAIIGAVVAGGGLALGAGAVTAAAMSVPLYIGYRAIRSVTGGTFGYYLQKYVGEKIVDSTYSHDVRKAYEETVEVKADELTRDEQLRELVLQRNFDTFAEKNYAYGKEVDLEFRKKEAVANKYRKWNRGLMTVLTGVIGGNLGAQLIDTGADVAMGAVASTGAEHIVNGPKSGEINPEHIPPSSGHVEDLATAHKGDSVWRLIEEDSAKNVKGFSDLNEAQKTYFIDHLKDQVTADPHKFGLENADQIKVGYGKELDSLFENNQDIQNALESAKHLSREQMESIMQSNASQRAAFLESMKPKVSHEILGAKTNVLNEVVVTPEGQTETFVVKGTDAFGVETTKELPIDIKGNNELSQAYLNYKGNPNFVEGTQPQDWAKANGAESLVKLTEQHPEYLKIGAVRDALREIHTNNLVDELHEGGAFKFLNSSDNVDLMRETTGLAKTYGLDTYRAQSFTDYIAQGHEMNEQTFTQFTDPETGSFLSDNFQGAISKFHELETLTTPPSIPDGATSSFWEPRLLSPNNISEPVVGLVRQSAPDIFEFKTPTGIIDSNLTFETIDKMIVKPPSIQK
ncbi:MAG: hypothetical protein WC842_01150 [Candidatus Paceibacterota bacterium]|jgi:hypothetical protein